MLTVTRLGVALIAVCVSLINVYLDYVILIESAVTFSVGSLCFFSRHLLCYVAAYASARYGNIDTGVFALLFIVPSLLLLHGLIIWKSNGMLELWPPILGLDAVLFLPALFIHGLGKRQRTTIGDTHKPV
jgi:hypothetical protein